MPAKYAAESFSPTHYTSFCKKLSFFHSLNSFQIFGQKLFLSNNFNFKMTAPLQIISISTHERTNFYQTYLRESVAIVQQQRERLASSPFNVLAANQHWQEWSTKSHIMLPHYVFDTSTFFARSVSRCMKALQSINPTRLSKRLK